MDAYVTLTNLISACRLKGLHTEQFDVACSCRNTEPPIFNHPSGRDKGNQHLVSKSCKHFLVGEFYQLHRKLSGHQKLVAIQLKFHKYSQHDTNW